MVNKGANHRPVTFISSAAPITSTTSARRDKPLTGNNTAVIPHTEHRERRGRTSSRLVPDSRRADHAVCDSGVARARGRDFVGFSYLRPCDLIDRNQAQIIELLTQLVGRSPEAG
ncbi:hypothetical protein [Streptomyces sp. NBC_00853]|uniref:hypothetical protein n=1 Tax=Streptomyces sp. NBC_00853 TaxID=2903681 RepID=UPI0038738E40